MIAVVVVPKIKNTNPHVYELDIRQVIAGLILTVIMYLGAILLIKLFDKLKNH